jgi:hypothetical protein
MTWFGFDDQFAPTDIPDVLHYKLVPKKDIWTNNLQL